MTSLRVRSVLIHLKAIAAAPCAALPECLCASVRAARFERATTWHAPEQESSRRRRPTEHRGGSSQTSRRALSRSRSVQDYSLESHPSGQHLSSLRALRRPCATNLADILASKQLNRFNDSLALSRNSLACGATSLVGRGVRLILRDPMPRREAALVRCSAWPKRRSAGSAN